MRSLSTGSISPISNLGSLKFHASAQSTTTKRILFPSMSSKFSQVDMSQLASYTLNLPPASECKYQPKPSEQIENLTSDIAIAKAVEAHQVGEIEKGNYYLCEAANMKSTLGLLLYGISLRNGWGCTPNLKLGFECLIAAAREAMSDILAKKNTEDSVAEHQLALSLFELGVCYMQGWGIAKNKKWGAYYYEIAADLGEPDAQNEIAHCYLNGKGVKKDKYKAAYFFQLASEQGNGYMGNAWIYKDKYLNQEPPQLNTSI